jgi:hypothetical protein
MKSFGPNGLNPFVKTLSVQLDFLKRFEFLKIYIQYHDPKIIEQAIKCCGMIYNMLLHHDNLNVYAEIIRN